MQTFDEFENPVPQSVWNRLYVICIAAGVSMIIGMLIPIPRVIDLCWAITFCIGIGVVYICSGAKNSSELKGFVFFLAAFLLLNLGATSACVKQIITHKNDPPGMLVTTLQSGIPFAWPVTLLLCLGGALVMSLIIVINSQRITEAALHYCRRIYPLKRIGLQTDLRMNVLDVEQAGQLNGKINAEYEFFANMIGLAKLICTVAGLEALLLLVMLISSVFGQTEELSRTDLLKQMIGLTAGLSLLSLLPLAIVTPVCGNLMNKESLSLKRQEDDKTTPSNSEKVTYLSKETGQTEEVELLNPSFVNEPSKAGDIAPDKLAKFEQHMPNGQPNEEKAVIEYLPIRANDADDYYDTLTKEIHLSMIHKGPVLLGSDSVQTLPVTIAVNVAIRLTQDSRRVLLIDTAPIRNAVAKVFELDGEKIKKSPEPTLIDNLSALCVPADRDALHKAIESAKTTFDRIVIYAPEVIRLNAEQFNNQKLGTSLFFIGETTYIGNAAESIQPDNPLLHLCKEIHVVSDMASALSPTDTQ